MRCHRCSQPLPRGAARCARCGSPVDREDFAPVSISFAAEDAPADVDGPDVAISEPAPAPNHTVRRRTDAPVRTAQLLAWCVDLAILCACAAAHVALAWAVLGRSLPSATADSTIDLLRGGPLPLLWLGLFALLALAYSWTFAALGGRTPGLALAGLRIASSRGGAPTPREALARAALSVGSAGLGLFGFALALVDPRGQTLHDKLAGTRLERG
jgi:uncharacterized RDD family membrane protein YckC